MNSQAAEQLWGRMDKHTFVTEMSLAMYRYVGVEPTRMDILVNKSSVHFRADFDPIAETVLVCTAPGPMPLDPADLAWTKLRPGMRLSPGGPVHDPARPAAKMPQVTEG